VEIVDNRAAANFAGHAGRELSAAVESVFLGEQLRRCDFRPAEEGRPQRSPDATVAGGEIQPNAGHPKSGSNEITGESGASAYFVGNFAAGLESVKSEAAENVPSGGYFQLAPAPPLSPDTNEDDAAIDAFLESIGSQIQLYPAACPAAENSVNQQQPPIITIAPSSTSETSDRLFVPPHANNQPMFCAPSPLGVVPGSPVCFPQFDDLSTLEKTMDLCATMDLKCDEAAAAGSEMDNLDLMNWADDFVDLFPTIFT